MIILLLNDSYYNLQEGISAASVIVAILQYAMLAGWMNAPNDQRKKQQPASIPLYLSL